MPITIKPVPTMMTINSFKYLFLFTFLILIQFNFTYAQKTESRLRLSGEIEKDFTKKFNASLGYEHRFNQNISVFDKAILEPSVSYDIYKGVRVGAAYRFIVNQGRNSRAISHRGRTSAYVRYRYRHDDFVFKLRSQIQYGFDDITYIQLYYSNELVSRNSLKIEYRWFGTRITPFARYELFTHLNNPFGIINNQWKLRGGFNYQLTHKSRITAQYTYENEFNVPRPMNAHVFALGFRYSL